MRILHSLDDLNASCLGGALAIGNFDGVHQGHARIISEVLRLAKEYHGPAVVLTFDPHPARLLRPNEAPPPLTWLERKAELLEALGVAVLVAYPTTEEVLQLSADDFFHLVVVERLQSRAIAEGPNFRFGRNRAGDIHILRQLCDDYGILLSIVAPVVDQGEYISSSRIRAAIRQGDIASASRMLAHPYRIRGMVTHGARRGTQLGFPTANLEAIDTLVPGHGVYAGQAVVHGARYRAAIHIGPNPTFHEGTDKVEVHLLDYHGSIQGEPLEVQFDRRLRDVRKFDSAAELVGQLTKDVAEARRDPAE